MFLTPVLRYVTFLVLFCASSVLGLAQPLVYGRAVVNAASFMPQGLPGGGIARGSLFSVFGTRFGPGAPAQANSFPLDTSLSNVSVTITQGGTTVNAIPVFVSNTQVNAILPSNAPLGTATLRVVYFNARSNPVPVRIVDSAFGIFTATGAGVGPGILQNYIAPDNQPINAPAITAKAGQTMTLWGTGLGAVAADNVAPAVGAPATRVEVFVGGKLAKVAYSGRTPCCSGTDQIVFTVPDDAPQGCWVPVYVRTAGTTVSNTVTMAIEGSGAACSDAGNPLSRPLAKGGKAGIFVAVRARTREDVGVRAPVDVVADYHASAAFDLRSGPFPFNALASLPPPGTCTAIASKGDLLGGDVLASALPSGNVLDLGPMFSLSGPKGTKVLTPLFAAGRAGYLGGNVTPANLISNSLFLDPGSYSVRGIGGSDVGPFAADFTVPQPLAWTNRDQLSAVERTQPLSLSWTGAAADQMVAVVGVGVDLPTNASAAFACLSTPGATGVSVPATVLANLPATRANVLQSKSVIYVISSPTLQGPNLQVSGLDTAGAMYAGIDGKTVVFR